ncbi:HXXEE domain-containing protein [Tsukamurella sp. NPDC003166]|uniref:HXXEE domain-containing protein n=1 Tax=Tsukamurella sp. NPDC003166 TaxID=3154444 RepID=UPI0033B5E37D
MTELIHWWLSVWLWVTTAIGIAFVVHIARKWNTWGWGDRLTSITVVWLVAHVWEEWVLPGGFHFIYNGDSANPDRYPMSELTDMVTNFGLIVIPMLMLLRWGARTVGPIAAMFFCLLEVGAHIQLAFRSLDEFGDRGQTLWYAPGLVTALIGYLPLLIALIVYLVRTRPRPTWKQWIAGFLMFAAFIAVFIFGAESLLKDPNSPYPYPNHGYYDQFVGK